MEASPEDAPVEVRQAEWSQEEARQEAMPLVVVQLVELPQAAVCREVGALLAEAEQVARPREAVQAEAPRAGSPVEALEERQAEAPRAEVLEERQAEAPRVEVLEERQAEAPRVEALEERQAEVRACHRSESTRST